MLEVLKCTWKLKTRSASKTVEAWQQEKKKRKVMGDCFGNKEEELALANYIHVKQTEKKMRGWEM